MGWKVQNEGMMVVFSRDIPLLVSQTIKEQIEQFIGAYQLTLSDITSFYHTSGRNKGITGI